MKGVGGAERSLFSREQEVLRATVDFARQLDTVVRPFVQTREDRVLESSRGLARERALVQAPGNGGDDLGDGKIRRQDIVPALDDLVEFRTASLRKIELEQRAGVAVERPG